MNIYLDIFLALLICFFILGGILIITYYLITIFYLPMSGNDMSVMTNYTMLDFWGRLLYGTILIPATVAYAILQTLSQLKENSPVIIVLLICSGGALTFLRFQHVIIYTWLVGNQYAISPILDYFVLPLLNVVRLIFDVLVPIVNFLGGVVSFLIFQAPKILFACTAQNFSLANIVDYAFTVMRTLFTDLKRWIHDDPKNKNLSILNSLHAFGDFAEEVQPIPKCFCAMLDFVTVYIITVLNFLSLHHFLNGLLNIIVNLVQLPVRAIMTSPHVIDFDPLTLTTCGAIQDFGEIFEELLYLSAETLYGLITNEDDLPPVIAGLLSAPFSQILTHPMCAVVRVVNMTLVGAINIKQITSPVFLTYLQFGFVLDEFKVAAKAVAEPFGAVFNPDAESLVLRSLYAVVDAAGFVHEYVIGNVGHVAYGNPLNATFGRYGKNTTRNFWHYFFVDYWLKAIPFGTPVTIGNYTYSSSLDQLFSNVFLAIENIGNLVGLFNDPLGQLVNYLLKMIVSLVYLLANIVSYSYTLITFGHDMPMETTPNFIDFELFFRQAFFFAGALGDSFRQLQNESRTCKGSNSAQGSDADKNFWCQLGNFLNESVDIIAYVLKTVINFFQDLLTLPSGALRLCIFGIFDADSPLPCARLADFSVAIDRLEDALCSLANTVTSIIPDFGDATKCMFPAPRRAPRTPLGGPPALKPCNKVQSCIATELCNILKLFLVVPLSILNALFIKTNNASAFQGFTDFFAYSIGLIVNQFALCFEYLGLLLDCMICAFGGTKTNCKTEIYDVFKTIGDAVRELADALTGLLFTFIKLILLLIVGLFASDNPIGALIDFIVSFAQDIFNGLGTVLLNFLVSLLDAMGLGFLGGFIQVIYQGLCHVLQVVINVILVAVRVLSFGYINKSVSFCCSGNCKPSQSKRSEEGVIDDLIEIDINHWLKTVSVHYNWAPGDICNATVNRYKEMNWTTMDDYQQGETIYCFVKLMWNVRDDGQLFIGNSTCDAMILEHMGQDWSTLRVLEKRTMIECMNNRLYVEVFRSVTNMTWFPQDMLTNSFRKYHFTAELMKGYLLNWQFFSDKTKPTEVVISPSYHQYWVNLGLNISHYQNLTTVEDVPAFREKLHLIDYFIANDARQYNATLYTVTGLWSMLDMMVQGVKNMSFSFSDNTTDPGIYVAYNYTLENSIEASASSLLGMLSRFAGMISHVTSYWKDPVNYKKRSEAYEKLTLGGNLLYKESINQLRLMALEKYGLKVVEGRYYNNTCSSEEECKAEGVTQFSKEYHKSFYGEDEHKGETSLLYKISKWWEKAEFKAYEIENQRYPPLNKSGILEELTYTSENGTILTETRYDRFFRYIALVRQGTPASNRRWSIISNILDYSKDKIYTGILKSYYNNRSEYEKTEHHIKMKNKHEVIMKTSDSVIGTRNKFQKPVIDCHPLTRDVSLCKHYYDFRPIDYDTNLPQSQPQYLNESIITKIKSAHQKSSNHILHHDVLSDMIVRSTGLLSLECVNLVTVTFNCSKPLECKGKTTTTLCEQCRYFQSFVDTMIALITQMIALYREGGQFDKSLDRAYQFFEYSVNENYTVVVGDSRDLHVALFPSKGATLYESFMNSMRYLDDDTPNKLGFDDFYNLFGQMVPPQNNNSTVLNNNTSTNIDYTTINGIMTLLSENLFPSVQDMFYRAYVGYTNGNLVSNSLAGYITDTFVFCDNDRSGDDLNGVNKRFAIAKLLVFSVAFVSIVVISVTSVFGFNIFTVFLSASGSGTFVLLIFQALHANKALFCPGFSAILADDLFYALAYNFFPKCSWFFGFMMKSPYDNNNCYSRTAALNATLYNCPIDLGFTDITMNIIFFVEAYAPFILTYIRTQAPFNLLYKIPFLNSRLDHFADVDLENPFVWSRYMGCNVIMTLPFNLFLVFAFFTISALVLSPLLMCIYTIFLWAVGVLNRQSFALGYMVGDFARINNIDDDYDDEDDDYDDEDDDYDEADEVIPQRKRRFRYTGDLRMKSGETKTMKKNNPKFTKMSNVVEFYRDNWYGDKKTR